MTWKDGDIVRYNSERTHARHGIARVHVAGGSTWAFDTYWGLDELDYGSVSMDCLDPNNILGNIYEFETRCQYPYEYDDFADGDRFYLPVGGGSAQHWIRKGAQPVMTQVRDRLLYGIETERAAVESAKRRVELSLKEYRKFMGEHPEVPVPVASEAQ